MIRTDLLEGEKVRLIEMDPERDSKSWVKWFENSEYMRHLDSEPSRLRSEKISKDWMEKHLGDFLEFQFYIQTIADKKIIGGVGLDGNIRIHQEAFVGIGIGEPEFWGKGYGTDAMRLILRYGFLELNLHRVSLNVFGYNARAIQSYLKTGFQIEARSPNFLIRDGKRWDLVWMGILREEWSRNYANKIS